MAADIPGNASSSVDKAAFTVVITRPAGQSNELIAQLAAAGVAVLDFPLIDIAPVTDEAPLRAALASLERYALVVFVSPNAVDHAFARSDAIWPHALPIGVVGPGSVQALARHGVAAPAYTIISPPSVAEDDTARFDSEGLFAAIDTALGATSLEGKRVLIVRGDGGREWLADRLREAGAEVETVAAYRRLVPEPSIGGWARVHALLAGAPHAWLLTSSEGVRNLHELAQEHLTAEEITQLKHANLVAPHPRIAQTARALGFDSITVSGAGDERIARALLAAVPTVVQPVPSNPAHSPAKSRMTETNASTNASPQPAATTALPPNPPFTPYEAQEKRRSASGPLLWFVVVIIACAAGVGGYALNRKVERTEQQLVQRQQANDAQTNDLRVKTDQALATVHQSDSQVAQLEGKLADAQTAQQALQQQYSDLARNRDDWTMAEVGQMLSAASQQLQLTGNTQLALFALQSADTRLAASDSPQAVTVRKAIAQDIDKLKAAPSTDLTGMAIKLDNAIDQVDSLPLSGEAPIAHATPKAATWADTAKVAAATGEPRWKVWWREVTTGIGQQLTSLVQVRRIDNADAMLVTPDQGYFVRENLKLRLLSARLALLSRNQTTLKSDLQAAQAALTRYFDNTSKKTQTVVDLVKQVDAGSAAVELPTLNTSLQAVNQYRSRG
ncbi:UNVERIFIED_ORG: uroporphyrinogen III methyltransferase/synthase [Paraburkholderia sediminicola]|uniref:fused uroporphyrinogen-III synthase HemD/membrane protein HemX n=1 Tax=Paraburkholderia TaxID=1822464 RepID=UPI002111DD2C|nr:MULTISPECIES: fused uroporphyrinogen-III synthase HemD/membrane protein HemX [Paraburkholderia]MCP2087140.1 uroporphyrinogen III methyltransferase/synthase [Paraburkholderia sediminicola]MCX4139434.1 fused uroporphyrinogen-III synthase HemD/membrane protein HemX [Paraburkholderia aspalathi]MDN7172121.1 fused uroporphyrinogen-III synthase HemD/membrane protein HemX [Paraburkholderia sp. SEWSISQ10-3 4]MDQ6501760.1 fused uroporphyrinogen-III synthase HemD/membrane protein HemX [Paraburkholderia